MSFLRLPTIGQNKKQSKRLYNTDLLWKAYRDVKDKGVSVYRAARVYGVPESTLRDRTLGLQPAVESKVDLPRSGASAVFTREQEKQLVDHVSYMTGIGYGYTRHDFLNLATDFAVSLGIRSVSDAQLTHSWFTGFKNRNPEVCLSKPQKLSLVRARCTSKEVLDKYFEELKNVMDKYDLTNHPEYIWNVDETGLMMEHNPHHVVCIKGQTPQAVTSNRGKTVTVIAAGSAAGTRIPPFFVFPGKRWCDSLLEGASPGSVGIMSETGWSNSAVFLEFLNEHFKKLVPTSDHAVLVLFDGHKSHVNLTLSTWAAANNVVFFVLPPHTSHITQPLDVGCFGPLKNAYYSECQTFMRRNPGMQVTRYNIAELAGNAYNKGVTAGNLISSFRKTGIYPLNRMEISCQKTAPATIYNGGDNNGINACNNEKSTFLDSKKITVVPSVTPKRKVPPTITGDIRSPSKKMLLKPAPSEKISQKSEPKSKRKSEPKGKRSKPLSPVPCTSGVFNNVVSSDSESETSVIDEQDLCCVCHKARPDALNLDYILEIVLWAQCDVCNHWTHLKFCSSVRCVRRGDTFLCPHCT
ncbi:jerky protein homolog-like isoform X2 [Mercenaria mercenaria]|uniref:jerky protein homolog-like isoform X2 n=1 Tax=Mercenaria mercenaria TaxID=6596 RepID=UPI001E1D91A5|nr:jerky protein homolog-like isoform X2 [Mercenaria mercenaria]